MSALDTGPAHVGWLERVVQMHVSPELRLAQNDQAWSLSLIGSDIGLRVNGGIYSFMKGIGTGACGEWSPSSETFESALGVSLPMPGATTSASPLWELTEDGGNFSFDVLSLAWWMLARVEEVNHTDMDQHGRFPATASHAFRHNYLERPIVDEWFQILRQLAKRVWPNLELATQQASIRVSHDVDSPSRYAFGGPAALLRSVGGDLLRRHQVSSLVRGPQLWLGSRKRLQPEDPSNTFDWLMDRSDEHGLTSAFYFICGRTDVAKDAAYVPEDPRIRTLMRHIHARGHEIGLHPSYGTYRSPKLIAGEAARLRRICEEEGIRQSIWGGRMHFLRWETPTTMHGWEKAGMSYDSTLSYADRPGFRCGTCHEYPAFDPVAGEQLQLRIRPLIAMECTVMAPRYLGLGDGEAALDKFVQLKRTCYAVGGCFTTLWHNTYLEVTRHRDLYTALLAA